MGYELGSADPPPLGHLVGFGEQALFQADRNDRHSLADPRPASFAFGLIPRGAIFFRQRPALIDDQFLSELLGRFGKLFGVHRHIECSRVAA